MIALNITTETPEQLANILAMFNPSSVQYLSHEQREDVDLSPVSSITTAIAEVETPAHEVAVQPTTPPADKTGKKGRSKKADTIAPAEKENTVAPTENIVVETPPVVATTEQVVVAKPVDGEPTIDDIRSAMTQVSQGKGLLHVKELLEKFGVCRAGDLDPAKYRDFLIAASELKS